MLERFWDRDTWLVRQKTRIVWSIFAVFFVSMVMSCQELHYMVSGRVIDAAGSTHRETILENGVRRERQVLTYSFVDGTASRGQTIEVPLNWAGAENGMVKVQYIPGRDTSRLLGQSNKIWVVIFLGSLVLAVIGGWVLVKYG